MGSGHTPGPWHLCQHLKGMVEDQACSCGYRGVIFGPETDVCMAVCQPGHESAPEGQEGTEPCRYSREVELANARLIAAAPELLEALEKARDLVDCIRQGTGNMWWVDATDPETAVCDTEIAIRAAIAKATGAA